MSQQVSKSIVQEIFKLIFVTKNYYSFLFQANLIDTKSVIRQHGGPVVGDGTNNDTTFYITLTIEQDDDDDDPLERIDSKIFILSLLDNAPNQIQFRK